MIYPVEPGWLRTSDALDRRERRQESRDRKRRDEGAKRGGGSRQHQEVPFPEAITRATFDLVA